MVVLAALAGILLAVFLLEQLGVIRRSRAAMSLMRATVVSLADPALNDLAKERLSRAAAVQMFRAAGAILLGLGAVFAAPVLLLWLGAGAGLFSLDQVAAYLMSWEGIGIGLTLFAAVTFLRGRSR